VNDLVRAAQRGDPLAMDALVRALTPYVGRICGAVALDRGDDAMQETFIAVLRNIDSLREPTALHGWVRRIAVREAIRQARSGDRLAEPSDEPAPDIDLANTLDVRAVLSELTPEHRAVLVLRDMDGLAETDIAALLQLPQGTVKSRLNRARTEFARRWRR
jgi:RNA polymerase sigma factor (sigma-70 family)